jgi:steroid delta-isomerase-like uncharacterized protein
MAAEENKAIVRRYLEQLYNRGELAAADQIIDPVVVFYEPARIIRGREDLKRRAAAFRAAFPDLQVAIEDELVEGDRVATRWTLRGTHRGEFAGIAPTGKAVNVAGIIIWRVAGGKIREAWGSYDALGLMQQLGVIDAPS